LLTKNVFFPLPGRGIKPQSVERSSLVVLLSRSLVTDHPTTRLNNYTTNHSNLSQRGPYEASEGIYPGCGQEKLGLDKLIVEK